MEGGGHPTSSRAHALCNPLSTEKRIVGLLPDTLLVHVASRQLQRLALCPGVPCASTDQRSLKT